MGKIVVSTDDDFCKIKNSIAFDYCKLLPVIAFDYCNKCMVNVNTQFPIFLMKSLVQDNWQIAP
jgi:hypothetical protein